MIDKLMPTHKKIVRFIVLALCLIWIVITGVKFLLLDYNVKDIFPRKAYRVSVNISAVPGASEAKVTHFLGMVQAGQEISDEKINGSFEKYEIFIDGNNRYIQYLFAPGEDEVSANISFLVRSSRVLFKLPQKLAILSQKDEKLTPYLKSSDFIQSEADEIIDLAKNIDINEDNDAISVIEKVFNYCYSEIENKNFSGVTDAVLTAQLGEASCNGKSRLMVALLRHKHIPARLTGGFIMGNNENKRTTHQWVEVYVNGNWIPFCPLNGYYGEKPSRYMKFYTGDLNFFKHTKDVSFKYHFTSKSEIVPVNKDFSTALSFDMIMVWEKFRDAGITLAMLSTILVIPLGALVTIVFRNVIGVNSFGTFLPALIAYSFMSTGFWWGLGIFSIIIGFGTMINFILDKFKLLHTPKLTIIMVAVAIMIIAIAYIGMVRGNTPMAYSLFFPLAILSLTIERFFSITMERGLKHAVIIYLWTIVIVAFSYVVMKSVFIQVMVIVLPEIYLLVIASSLYLGHWTGLRVSELFRFRNLLFEGAAK